ncbi:hypothetical protein MMC11_003780 [Xylographa trunciseda]|nr:hypothetical protein [Xylographa trunciseda]
MSGSYTTPPPPSISPGTRTYYSISGNTSYPYYVVTEVTTEFITTETLGTLITTDSTLVTVTSTKEITLTTTAVDSTTTTLYDTTQSVFTSYITTGYTSTVTEYTVWPYGTGPAYYSIAPPNPTDTPVPQTPRVRRVVKNLIEE